MPQHMTLGCTYKTLGSKNELPSPTNDSPVTDITPAMQAKNEAGILTEGPSAFTLRVRGGDPKSDDPKKHPTDPVGLSRSILHVLRQNQDGWVNVQCVGAKAIFVACIAFQMAATEIERYSRSVRLVNTQWTYAAEIGGKPAKGICMRIFAIPEINAR